MIDILITAVWGATKLSISLALIVIPIVILFEVLRHMPIFIRLRKAVEPTVRPLGLSPQSILPLATGLFLGIAYGAGILVRVAKERNLPKRELFLTGLFLATCHAVIEDTLLFVAISGNGWWIIGIRLIMAITLVCIPAWLWEYSSNRKNRQSESETNISNDIT